MERISNCWERYRGLLKVQSWLWPLRSSIRGRTHLGDLSANAWDLGKSSIKQEGMGHLKGRGARVAFAPIPQARMKPPPQAAAPRSREDVLLITG